MAAPGAEAGPANGGHTVKKLNVVLGSLDFILADRELLRAGPWFLPFWRARVCSDVC